MTSKMNPLDCGWNENDWLTRFAKAKEKGNTHPERAEVFRSTVGIVSHGEYTTSTGIVVPLHESLNPNAVASNKFYTSEIAGIKVDEPHQTIVKVLEEDCLAVAHRLLAQDPTDDVCVLNMASAGNPGGGVYNGAGAQEEYLFRCSDYYRFLFQYARTFSPLEYGIKPNPTHRYPLDSNFGGVFSHGITVFRDRESAGYALIEQPWKVNAVAVAAVDVKHHRVSYGEYMRMTLNKIRAILRIGYTNGQRRLVLGAFGCGAFGNDPYVVAALFRQVLDEPEFQGAFREIHFAILEDHNSHGRNFRAFSRIFGKGKKVSETGYADRIKETLRRTGRNGIGNVITWLEEHRFFEVPASVRHHNNFTGGLAKHSWEVYEIACRLNGESDKPLPQDSIAICALLHDVCKTDTYYISPRTGKPRRNEENYRKGHGLRSVNILEGIGLTLTHDERMAIWWHIGEHEMGGDKYPSEKQESETIPLCCLIRKADGKAAHTN